MEAAVKEAAEAKGKEFVAQMIADRTQYKDAIKWVRRVFIEAAIRDCGNNKRKACREFGMHVNSEEVMRVRIKPTIETATVDEEEVAS